MATKKAFLPLLTALTALAKDNTLTLADTLALPNITKLFEAGKGGFSGEDSFLTIDNIKVARVCAMTGAVFTHNNSDKTASFYYKNGSYLIGAEIVKATARKEWEDDREAREAELEDEMMDGTITPKEWKEQVTAIKAEPFDFELDEDTKAELIEAYDGYPTKEAYQEALEAGEVKPFTDYDEVTAELRSRYVAPEDTAEDEAEAEA